MLNKVKLKNNKDDMNSTLIKKAVLNSIAKFTLMIFIVHRSLLSSIEHTTQQTDMFTTKYNKHCTYQHISTTLSYQKLHTVMKRGFASVAMARTNPKGRRLVVNRDAYNLNHTCRVV